MQHYVYALKSKNKNYIYVGLTSDLEDRIKRHNDGRERTTKFYRPFTLIHVELADNNIQARIFEKYFKSGYGKETLREIASTVGMAELADAHA